MKYRVVLMPSAEAAIDAHIDHIAIEKQEPLSASVVLGRIRDAISNLDEFPDAAPYAPENAFRDYEIRMRVIDRCRLLFNVDGQTRTVRIIWFVIGGHEQDETGLPVNLDHGEPTDFEDE